MSYPAYWSVVISDTLPLNRQANIVTTVAGVYRALCGARRHGICVERASTIVDQRAYISAEARGIARARSAAQLATRHGAVALRGCQSKLATCRGGREACASASGVPGTSGDDAPFLAPASDDIEISLATEW